MVDELTLLSGVDILFKDAQVVIHQPTLKEIGYVGEEDFLLGCEFLNFDKNKLLAEQDKSYLSSVSNFEIFMSILLDSSDAEGQLNTERTLSVLTLLFPGYEIQLNEQAIILAQEKQIPKTINIINFEEFKQYIQDIFCLDRSQDKKAEFNPAGSKSAAIAAKLEAARKRKQKGQDQDKKMNILSRFMSILSVGQNIPLVDFQNYTVYQLYDAFDRYTLKSNFDTTFSAKIAGATGVEDAENWMNDIHLS